MWEVYEQVVQQNINKIWPINIRENVQLNSKSRKCKSIQCTLWVSIATATIYLIQKHAKVYI